MIHAKSMELAEAQAPPLPAPASAVPAGEPGKSGRFFHLDALRAALMFWGILVHASTVSDSALFRGAAVVSGLVRMEAFFVISGFLAYMLLKKYGAKVTVRRRLLAIGLPFATALILLNPPTNYLIYCYHNPPVTFAAFLRGEGTAGAEGPMNWHLHLWFLVALFVYSLLAPFIARAVDGGLRAARGRDRGLPREAAFFAMSAVMAAACIAARVAFEAAKPVLPGELHYVARSVGNFLPFYTLGMLLFASPALRELFSGAHRFQIVLSCGLLACIHRFGGDDPGRAMEVLLLAAQTYVAVCLSSFLFWLAGKWVKAESRLARSLSDAAYSVYLFHFLALYLFAFLFRPLLPGGPLLLAVISAATFAATLCLHRFVIRRLPLLELLFNGKPPRRAR